MRVIHIAVLTLGTTFLPTAALAKSKPKAPAAEAAPVESAAARAARLALADDTGALRDTSLHGSALELPTVKQEASTAERTPTQAAEVARSTEPLSGALEELVAKQRGRNENAFDHCVAEARTRNPQLGGEIELAVHVAARHATAEVASGAQVDPEFGSCVAQTAKALKLSLPDLSFPWRISLGHAPAPKTASAGAARAALP